MIEEQGCVTVLWVGQEQCVINPAPGTCGESTAHSTAHVQSQPSIVTDLQGDAFVPLDILASKLNGNIVYYWKDIMTGIGE